VVSILITEQGRVLMQIDKQQIIDFLRSRGDNNKASEAAQQLPDQVDPEGDPGRLPSLGIEVNDLPSRLPGGVGENRGGTLKDKVGGLGVQGRGGQTAGGGGGSRPSLLSVWSTTVCSRP